MKSADNYIDKHRVGQTLHHGEGDFGGQVRGYHVCAASGRASDADRTVDQGHDRDYA